MNTLFIFGEKILRMLVVNSIIVTYTGQVLSGKNSDNVNFAHNMGR